MSKKKTAISKLIGAGLLIAMVIGGALLVITWKSRSGTVRAEKSEPLYGLTADDIVVMLENQALVEPSRTFRIVETAETRKVFLAGLREYLALAARARREGLADDPNIQLVTRFKKNSLLGKLYLNKLDNDVHQADARRRYYVVPKEETERFWKDSENENQFRAEMQALWSIQKAVARNTGNPDAAQDVSAESSEKTRSKWAENRIIAAMARADSQFINQRAVALRLSVTETGVLSAAYLNKHWGKNVRVTEEEIRGFLTAHPEYDLGKKRAKAETILQRAKAGEEFAKLAADFSEDRATREKGGLYENIEPELLWPEVRQAILKLDKGQIADRLIESADGYHIVQFVDQRVTKDAEGVEISKVSVRHILLQKRFEEPGVHDPEIPPPFLTPKEIAEAALLYQKRKRFVDEVVKAEKISLPDDFDFEVTEELRAASGVRIEKVINDSKAAAATK